MVEYIVIIYSPVNYVAIKVRGRTLYYYISAHLQCSKYFDETILLHDIYIINSKMPWYRQYFPRISDSIRRILKWLKA